MDDFNNNEPKKVDLTKHIPDSKRSGSSDAQQQNPEQNQDYQKVNGFAIASLVCSILSVICCYSSILRIISGIVAVGLAVKSQKQNENPNQMPSKIAVAGFFIGAISGFLGVLILLFKIVSWIGLDNIIDFLE